MTYHLIGEDDRLISISLSDGNFKSLLSMLPDYFKSYIESSQDENIRFTFDVTKLTFESAISGYPKNYGGMIFADYLGINIKNISKIHIPELSEHICDILAKNDMDYLISLLRKNVRDCVMGSLSFLSIDIVMKLFNIMGSRLEHSFYVYRATKNEVFITTFRAKYKDMFNGTVAYIENSLKTFDDKESTLVRTFILNIVDNDSKRV